MLERGLHIDSALPQNRSFLYLVLGSLYYRIQHETEGDDYFQRAIEDSNDKDAARIQIAQEIFEEKPYSEKGVAILQEIMETSPYYQEAFQSLTQNLTPKAFFQMFNTHESEDRLKDTELLNRALYHKIANEIVILKETVHLLVSGYNIADNRLPIILNSINDILAGIKQRREYEKVQVKEIPADDYDVVMSIISKTAHDISDFVNNELATLEEKIRIMLVKSAENNVLTKKLNKMLEQIKFSQSALHDLKSVNEGITIRNSDFHIKELFEQWISTPHIKNSTLTLDIRNGDSIFYGDQEKIKSFVKELVENSLRHNSEHNDLQIKITSKDEHSLPHTSKIAFFDKRKFLRIIVDDNGKGIPPEKKEWVFLPLKTSSEEGSGLGLFIIKRTLKEMHGHILETGTQGAKFEIYIPYLQGGETWNA
jgi:signal transduction histidine kinase